MNVLVTLQHTTLQESNAVSTSREESRWGGFTVRVMMIIY